MSTIRTPMVRTIRSVAVVATALALGATAGVVVSGDGGNGEARAAGDGAQASSSSRDAPSWLFVLQAGGGSLRRTDREWTLTLRDVDDRVVAFTDRPVRDAQRMTVDQMLAGVDVSALKPNAALALDGTATRQDVFTLELTEATFDNGTATLTLRVRPIGNSNPAGLGRLTSRADPVAELDFGAASLFVDNAWSNTCNAGVTSTVALTRAGSEKYSHDSWKSAPPAQIAPNAPVTIESDSGWARGCWWDASYQWSEGPVEYTAALHASTPYSADNDATCTVTAQPATASGYLHLKCSVSFAPSGGTLGAAFSIGPASSCVATVQGNAASPITPDPSGAVAWSGNFHPGNAPSTLASCGSGWGAVGPTTVVVDGDPITGSCASSWDYHNEYSDPGTGSTYCDYRVHWDTGGGGPQLAGEVSGPDTNTMWEWEGGSVCDIDGVSEVEEGADPWVSQATIYLAGAMS